MSDSIHPILDAHIHLDMYDPTQVQEFAAHAQKTGLAGWISVSRHLESCKQTKALHTSQPNLVFPAYGYHPEQKLPTQAELEELTAWMEQNRDSMVAVGEVGLPYYMRHEAEASGQSFDLQPYLELLEHFVRLAAKWKKPIVLHAVYEYAELACDLLEKHAISGAHFHWFKGPESAIRRMIEQRYNISITPDVLYEPEIQNLVKHYPLELMMVETDGPWPYEGPFAGHSTAPTMLPSTIRAIAEYKGLSADKTASILFENTRRLYRF